MNLTDAVNRARKGDRVAIDALYSSYKNEVFFLCLKLTGSKEIACDMLQYSYLHAFHKLSLLRNPEDFRAWLLAVAANRCKNFLREQKPDLFADTTPVRDPKVKYSIPESLPVSNIAGSDEARALISAQIDTMPDACRFAVMDCYFAGMSVIQSARIVECSEAVMKYDLVLAEKTIEEACDACSDKLPVLREYRGAGELFAILSLEAQRVHVPEYIAEAVGATALTLIKGRANTASERPASKEPSAPVRHSGRRIVIAAIALLLCAAIGVGIYFFLNRTPAPVNPNTDGTTDPVTDPVTDPPKTDPATEPPVTEPPATEPPVTEPPVTDPVTDPPETDPVTEPPVTEPPVTEPPVTEPPMEEGTTFLTAERENGIVITAYTGTASRVVIPDEIDGKPVTAIAYNAFRGNETITALYLSDSVKTIEDNAFRDCKNLTEVHLGGVTKLGGYVFYGCTSLRSFTASPALTSAGSSVFSSTPWLYAQLKESPFVIIGDGVLIKYVGTDTAVTVPENVKYIANAFYYDSKITSVVLPEGVRQIGIFAFCSCASLRSITIPASVTSIDAQAIYSCGALAEIHTTAGSYAAQWAIANGYESVLVYD